MNEIFHIWFSHARASKSGVYFYTYVLIQISHISSARWPHEACGYIWRMQVPIFWHLVLGFFSYTMKLGYTCIVWWGYLIYTHLLSYKPRKQFFEEGRKERRKRERERRGEERRGRKRRGREEGSLLSPCWKITCIGILFIFCFFLKIWVSVFIFLRILSLFLMKIVHVPHCSASSLCHFLRHWSLFWPLLVAEAGAMNRIGRTVGPQNAKHFKGRDVTFQEESLSDEFHKIKIFTMCFGCSDIWLTLEILPL